MTPRHAQLYWNGERLNDNPHVRRAPRDASRHQLRARAPGYRERAVQFALDRDVELKLSLKPWSRAPLSGVPSGTARGPEAPTTAAPVDCTEPSYFDRRGIKRYRPECLREAP